MFILAFLACALLLYFLLLMISPMAAVMVATTTIMVLFGMLISPRFRAWLPAHIEHILWGNLTGPELKKFLILSVLGMVLMMSTWGLKTLKDSLFIQFVGAHELGTAKLVSVATLLPLIFFYNFLASRFSLERIFIVICSVYATLFLGIGWGCLLTPPDTTGTLFFGASSSLIGWLAYLGTESFSSLITNHYYTYIAATTTTESAKRGFGLIIVATQIGNLLGPTSVMKSIDAFGFGKLLQLFALLIFTLPLLVKMYTRFVPHFLRTSDDAKIHEEKKEPTIFEGLNLLASNPYLMGLSLITIFQEFIGTMLDLQFKIMMSKEYTGVAYVQYFGSYAQANAILGIIFGFFGTSILLRKLGIRTCLFLYPFMIGSVVAYIWWHPALNLFFLGMVCIKTLGYTLNRPIQEIMFIPTTRSVKTQVKSIVDGLGKRGGKAAAGLILRGLAFIQGDLLTSSIYASLVTIAVWLGIAASTGKKYEQLMDNKEIIG